MNIKNWLNSNAWYEASAQHYAKAAPHIDWAILLGTISGALLGGLSSPITFKILKTKEITTKPIFEFAYTETTIMCATLESTENTPLITPLFNLNSTKINNPIQVFSDTITLPRAYYFPVVSTDQEYDNLMGVRQDLHKSARRSGGIQDYVPSRTWHKNFMRQHESSFRQLFPEYIRSQWNKYELENRAYYIITPALLTEFDCTVDEHPLTSSKEIKYNESTFPIITFIAVQYITRSVISIVIALASGCALRLAVHLTQAAIDGNSLKDAASKSWQETKAIGHAFLAAGDYAGGCLCKIFIDSPSYVANGIWNQTIGRFYHHDNEQDTDIAGDITDTSGARG